MQLMFKLIITLVVLVNVSAHAGNVTIDTHSGDSTISVSRVKSLSHEAFLAKTTASQGDVIIDVRTAGEFAQGHVPNAINIPHTSILDNVELLSLFEGRDMIFYCRSGTRASWVVNHLIKENTLEGATVYHLEGDMNGWRSAGLPIEK